MTDLAVDTALLRQAADAVEIAASRFTPDAGDAQAACPLADGSLGPSALGREVVAAAERRIRAALEAATALAAVGQRCADQLEVAADQFDRLEATLGTPSGPR